MISLYFRLDGRNIVSKNFEQTGFLFGANSVFIEELYQQCLNDPSSVDQSWVEFFSQQFLLIKDINADKIADYTEKHATIIDFCYDVVYFVMNLRTFI